MYNFCQIESVRLSWNLKLKSLKFNLHLQKVEKSDRHENFLCCEVLSKAAPNVDADRGNKYQRRRERGKHVVDDLQVEHLFVALHFFVALSFDSLDERVLPVCERFINYFRLKGLNGKL